MLYMKSAFHDTDALQESGIFTMDQASEVYVDVCLRSS